MNILQAHTRAVLALLDADDVPPPLVVLNGRVTTQAPPYVLVYFRLRTPSGVEAPELVSLEQASDVLDTWAYCHNIGSTPDAALAVAGRVRTQLLGVVPAIAGRVCFPIRHDDGQPVQRDEATGATVYDLVDVYTFTSLPG